MENKMPDLMLASKLADDMFDALGIELPEETSLRFVKMLKDLTSFQNVTNEEVASIVNKLFNIDVISDSKAMVLVKDIDIFSLCEHHIALMYDMKVAVGYIPNGQVLGLSKVVRVVDMVSKRLQLQERIGKDIIDIMKQLTKSDDIAVHIQAKHSCVTARGIRNVSSVTESTNFSGVFLENSSMQTVFINSVRS